METGQETGGLALNRMCSYGATSRIVAVLWASVVCATGASAQTASTPIPSSFPPPQLEMRVPFEPSAFPSAGRTYVTYELHLRNFATNPFSLRRVEVLDTDTRAVEPVAAFEAAQLDSIVQPVGARAPGDASGDRRQLAGGGSMILFLSIVFDRGAPVPNRLRHRVLTADSAVEGAEISAHHTELRVLGPPLTGSDWVARSGPSNDSYHRRGILVFDGGATIDRRYAIDWVQSKNGATFFGDALDTRSYYAYGEEVLAVSDGIVISARDGIPENVPRREGFRPAVPLSMETIAGNTISLDVGGGQFAYYMHLQAGSLRVKAGDRVRRGQVVARIGNSGDSREPHLHFEVTTSSKLLVGEGVPYLIDRYRGKSADDSWQIRVRELPLRDMVIDFGQAGRGK
jgi:murein DD-endopeptidase MepM/ murein hydrolase activator NlpD